jgi:hypothetical protein
LATIHDHALALMVAEPETSAVRPALTLTSYVDWVSRTEYMNQPDARRSDPE